jgi:hypothetical protein
MQIITTLKPKPQPAPTMRAIIEIDGGELKVFPIAQSDIEEKMIFDALRFMIEDYDQR